MPSPERPPLPWPLLGLLPLLGQSPERLLHPLRLVPLPTLPLVLLSLESQPVPEPELQLLDLPLLVPKSEPLLPLLGQLLELLLRPLSLE